MSEPVSNVEIEDVLSSIRRLVSEENRPVPRSETERVRKKPTRLVLTPSLLVPEPTQAYHAEKKEESAVARSPFPTDPDDFADRTEGHFRSIREDTDVRETVGSDRVSEVEPEADSNADTLLDLSEFEQPKPVDSDLPDAPWKDPDATLFEAAQATHAPESAHGDEGMDLTEEDAWDSAHVFEETLTEENSFERMEDAFVPETVQDDLEQGETEQNELEQGRVETEDFEQADDVASELNEDDAVGGVTGADYTQEESRDVKEDARFGDDDPFGEETEFATLQTGDAPVDEVAEQDELRDSSPETGQPDEGAATADFEGAKTETAAFEAQEEVESQDIEELIDEAAQAEVDFSETADTETGDAEEAIVAAEQLDTQKADTDAVETADEDAQVLAEGTDAPAEPVESDDIAAAASLSAKIAVLEAKIGQTPDQWEPDGETDDDYAGTTVETIQWQDHVGHKDDPEPIPFVSVETPSAEPEQAAQDDSDVLDVLPQEETILDEESLRELVADIVRQELQGALGERITRNVRKLVRREIHRALTAQELE